MGRDEVLKTLQGAQAMLQSRGVAHVALFGSTARGENAAESDIDIMVEIEPDAALGYFAYLEIVNAIRDFFAQEVEVANRRMLKAHLRPTAERDALYAF